MDRQPHEWQEQHSPTVWTDVVVWDGEGNTARARRARVCRREVDARLWKRMTSAQQTAAECIRKAHQEITAGLGAKGQSFERLDPAKYIKDRTALITAYWDWAQRAQREDVSVADILLILVDGWAPSAVDAKRRRRRGKAADNLIEGLEIYRKQQGWLDGGDS